MASCTNTSGNVPRRLQRALARLLRTPLTKDKYADEERFWRRELDNLHSWYQGGIAVHYRTAAPLPEERIERSEVRLSSILTWFELHQKPKYLHDLQLPRDAFRGLRVLDVGAGPMPSGEAFIGCELYCMDPLLLRYLECGWPLHPYGPCTRFVCGFSESMPFKSHGFDVVISVNAIDHVDDLASTAAEIRRVLRPEGGLCLHAHYHRPTSTEPIELDDALIEGHFGWCSGLVKVDESREKSSAAAGEGESFALWSNLHARTRP